MKRKTKVRLMIADVWLIGLVMGFSVAWIIAKDVEPVQVHKPHHPFVRFRT
jgi:hypothetical protein